MPEIAPPDALAWAWTTEQACFPWGGSFLSPAPSSTLLYQQLVLTDGLWKKINEMHPLVLIASVGAMAIDCAYVRGGLFCCLPQTEHTRSTYLFTLFPLEILEDTEHDGREPNSLVGWAPLSVRWNSECADSNKYLQNWGLECDGNCLPPLVWPVKSNSTWKALL